MSAIKCIKISFCWSSCEFYSRKAALSFVVTHMFLSIREKEIGSFLPSQAFAKHAFVFLPLLVVTGGRRRAKFVGRPTDQHLQQDCKLDAACVFFCSQNGGTFVCFVVVAFFRRQWSRLFYTNSKEMNGASDITPTRVASSSRSKNC